MSKKPPVAAESLPVSQAAPALPDDAPGLKAGLARLGEEQRACLERLRTFLTAENPGQGVFYAAEIFTLQQEKLRLEVEMEFYRRKLARLDLEESL